MAGTALAQGSSVTLTIVATDTILIDSGASGSATVEAVTGVPVHERTWHHCPVCGEALNTPKDLLKQGFMMVHRKCLTGELNAE